MLYVYVLCTQNQELQSAFFQAEARDKGQRAGGAARSLVSEDVGLQAYSFVELRRSWAFPVLCRSAKCRASPGSRIRAVMNDHGVDISKKTQNIDLDMQLYHRVLLPVEAQPSNSN